jgi:hypothetical protein
MAEHNFTPEQLREIVNTVCPEVRISLTPDHAEGIIKRIKREYLTPFDDGHSLHCWNQEYMIDGGHYSLTGEIANPFPFAVELVQPRR